MAKKKPTFKPYHQDQVLLLPPSLSDLVPKGHPARVVNDVIDQIDIKSLVQAYETRGSSSYHPQMLLKVLVYGYVCNIYSSRKLELACKENINFMWLSAMNYPDHNTINRFRGVRLKESLREVFEQVVQLLAQEGLLSIEEVYTDGTKIEASANKYTFVWKKSITTNKEKMKKQLQEIWAYAQSIARSEDDMPTPPDFTEINRQKVQETVDKLNAVLSQNPETSPKAKAKLRHITKNYPAQIAKYEQQEEILGERNSYAKTDPDATFMRMKEDHMKNGQLKPGYNVQISTSNQFIVNYTIHPNPTDTTTLKSHLEQHAASYGHFPQTLTADAGYGSEENYAYLDDKGIVGYVKYGIFDKEQYKKGKGENIFHPNQLFYHAGQDYYVCPMGQKMYLKGYVNKKTSTGYVQTYKRYRATNCRNCPLHGPCHKAKENRTIEVNEMLQNFKHRAYQLLTSPQGIEKRKRRGWDVETVFGNIKSNHGFRRFMLRGKRKVEIEWGLLAIAQNIRKKAA